MVFHDWPDADCALFLQNIREAMTPRYSRILINDAILPGRGAGIVQATFNVTMMAHHCAVERDQSMWKALVEATDGLEVARMWNDPGEGIVKVMRIN
jgi:hypothetical protein